MERAEAKESKASERSSVSSTLRTQNKTLSETESVEGKSSKSSSKTDSSLSHPLNVTSIRKETLKKTFEKQLLGKDSISCVDKGKSTKMIKMSENGKRKPSCSSDTSSIDPRLELKKLEKDLNRIESDIIECRNKNQILKKDMLVAKQVIKKAIGGNSLSFESLTRMANENEWTGRQEISFGLKRKIRYLTDCIAQIEGKSPSQVQVRRKAQRNVSAESIPEERQAYWRLKIERDHVIRHAKRDLDNLESIRDSLKAKVDPLKLRNEEMEEEVITLLHELRLLEEEENETVLEDLVEVEHNLKACLDGKAKGNRQLAEIRKQISFNQDQICSMKSKIRAEEQLLMEHMFTIESLLSKDEPQSKIQSDVSELYHGIKCKLDDIEAEYEKNIFSGKLIFSAMNKSRSEVETLFPQIKKREDCTPANLDEIPETQKDTDVEISHVNTCDIDLEEDMLLNFSNDDKLADEISHSSENTESILRLEIEPSKHKASFREIEIENCKQSENIFDIVDSIEDNLQVFLHNRFLLCKAVSEVAILKARWKRLRDLNSHLLAQKIKKKYSFIIPTKIERNLAPANLIEHEKQLLRIHKTENKFLKELIKHVIASKEDDFSMCNSFLYKNKELFVKCKDME